MTNERACVLFLIEQELARLRDRMIAAGEISVESVHELEMADKRWFKLVTGYEMARAVRNEDVN